MFVLLEYHIEYHIEYVNVVACSENRQLLEALKAEKELVGETALCSVEFEIETCKEL